LQNFGGIFVDTGQAELEETLPVDLIELTGDESDYKLSDELGVIHGKWLKERRREESVAALGALGVEATRRQHYLGLPDRDLNDPDIKAELSLRIAGVVLEILNQNPDKSVAIFTMGEEGCDGHSDHSATHEALIAAQGILNGGSRNVEVFALSREVEYGEDGIAFEVDTELAQEALAEHRTQMPVSIVDGKFMIRDEQAWGKIQEDYGQFFELQVFRRVVEDSASVELEAEMVAA
jgi:LmbE family N-acetylglucosaminyl deacetylase